MNACVHLLERAVEPVQCDIGIVRCVFKHLELGIGGLHQSCAEGIRQELCNLELLIGLDPVALLKAVEEPCFGQEDVPFCLDDPGHGPALFEFFFGHHSSLTKNPAPFAPSTCGTGFDNATDYSATSSSVAGAEPDVEGIDDKQELRNAS